MVGVNQPGTWRPCRLGRVTDGCTYPLLLYWARANFLTFLLSGLCFPFSPSTISHMFQLLIYFSRFSTFPLNIYQFLLPHFLFTVILCVFFLICQSFTSKCCSRPALHKRCTEIQNFLHSFLFRFDFFAH